MSSPTSWYFGLKQQKYNELQFRYKLKWIDLCSEKIAIVFVNYKRNLVSIYLIVEKASLALPSEFVSIMATDFGIPLKMIGSKIIGVSISEYDLQYLEMYALQNLLD